MDSPYLSLPYSDSDLENILASNGNLIKQGTFWKKRITEHLTAATARWPALYNFNQAEDHRNFTFNRFASKARTLREAYLLTLYAFDILVPENIEYFGLNTAILWFLQRQLPLPQPLLDAECDILGACFVFLMESDAPIEYIITFLRGRMVPKHLMLGALLKYGKGPWFDRFISQVIEKITQNNKSVFVKAALEPEIKDLIMPRVHYHLSQEVLIPLAEVHRVLELAKQKREPGEEVILNPEIPLPINYLDYFIFPFLSTFAKNKRTYYQILRALKGTFIEVEGMEKPEKLPLIEVHDYDDSGQLELALYLVEKDDPALLDHVLKCIRATQADDTEVCQHDLRARCLSHAHPNSSLFSHLLNTLPNSYLIPGPVNFQAAYTAFTKKQFTQFMMTRGGRFTEAMQILCSDFPNVQIHSPDCSSCDSGSEDDDE